MYSPEVRDLLRQRVETTLGQQPREVPSIESLYETKLPVYRRLLGDNQQTTQSQMLFDLAQRAFGYAANVDERGRPMRGGQLARVAGAFQGLPATIGARIGELEKGERAVKSAALSSAEKEAQRIMEFNQRLQTSQDRLLGALSGQAVREGADERRERLQREALVARTDLERNRQEALTLRNQNNNDTRRLVSEANNIAEAERQREALNAKLQTTTMSLEAKQGIANQVNALNERIAGMKDALGRAKIGSAESIAQAREVAAMERLDKQLESRLQIANLDNDTKKGLEAERLALRDKLETARMELQGRIADDKNITSRLNALDRNATMLQIAGERAAAAATPGFGKGLTAQQLNIFYQLSPSFGANTAGEEADRMFETAVVDYINRNTTSTTDPVTGERFSRVPALPKFVVTALTARGRQDLVPQSGSAPLGAPTVGAAAAGAAPGAPAPAPGSEPPRGRQPLDTRPLSLTPEEQQFTFFNVAKKGTGPIAIAGSMLSKFPGLGNLAPQEQTAKTFLSVAANQINRSLAVGDRFTESERQQIQNQLDALPQFIDNPTAYRNRLLGLDNLLGNLEQRAIRSYNSPTMNVADIRKAAANFEEVRNLRAQLGMPPRINNDQAGQAAYNALPPGAYFIHPNGKIHQKNAPR
jgi:hypothetical protein